MPSSVLRHVLLNLFESPMIPPIDVFTWTSKSSLGFPGSSLESVVWDVTVAYFWPLRPFVKLVD